MCFKKNKKTIRAGYQELLNDFSNCVPFCKVSCKDSLEFWKNSRIRLLLTIDKYLNGIQNRHKTIYGDNSFFKEIIDKKKKLNEDIQKSFDNEESYSVSTDVSYLSDNTVNNIQCCYSTMSNFVSEAIDMINKNRNIGVEKVDFLDKDYRKIFLVHGKNEDILTKIKKYLKKEAINAIVLKDNAGDGINFIWDKFVDEASNCRAAIVIASSDVTFQNDNFARPNVYLELGFFLAKMPSSNIVMLLDNPSIVPSDIHGIEYINYKADKQWLSKLDLKLKKMGF